MFYQLVRRDPRYGWEPFGPALFINNDDMQATDIKNAHDLAAYIYENDNPVTPVAMLDGLDYEAVMGKLQKMNQGYLVPGFPAKDAIDLMSRLLNMHPLEAGPGGDHDKTYHFAAPRGETAIRTLVKEMRRWTTIPTEDR
jgi:hypothetical protein